MLLDTILYNNFCINYNRVNALFTVYVYIYIFSIHECINVSEVIIYTNTICIYACTLKQLNKHANTKFGVSSGMFILHIIKK